MQLTPTIITSDYERALRNALKEVFGTAEHHGCITHFLRAVNSAYTQKTREKLNELEQTDVGSLAISTEMISASAARRSAQLLCIDEKSSLLAIRGDCRSIQRFTLAADGSCD